MAFDPKQVQAIFLQAAGADDRAAVLDRLCVGDAEIRKRVEGLLKAHDAASGFLDQPAGNLAATIDVPAGKWIDPGSVNQSEDKAGTLIGPYKLLQKIGEGGMGTVWMAEQQEPVRRMVAVKLVKAGMDSDKVVARFEAERQALALMDHPNIARIYDAGITGNRPFFVMELVKGTPITQYCDEHRLTPNQRLELFVATCAAIQHAHQKGIIHRDIKPSNVLVAPYDGRPVVKVIDFGVAKATGQRLTDKTMYTEFGAVVGTLEYMSPEQAELNNQDIDTRSDIYALGVLLYELLTGSTPLNRKSLKQQAMLEMLRMVREQEPPKPSTRLSTDDALPSISAQRHMDPAKLTKLMRGELDWIVMKSLEKDRNRRYETANGFGMDIQRYLAGDAVLACPPSTTYRLKKFLERNKGPVLAAGLVLFALLAGIVGTTFGLIEAKRQEQLATAAQQAEADRAEGERLAKFDAQEKEKLATAATELTAARLAQIETINTTVFDMFTEFDIRKVKADGKPVEAVLAQKLIAAGKKLDAKAIHDPLVLASLRNRLGHTLLSLGEAPAAIELLRAAVEFRKAKLGADHLDTLVSMNNLASGYRAAGKLDQALPLFEETLKLQNATFGPDHPHTLKCMGNVATCYKAAGNLDKALPLLEKTFNLMSANLGADHPDTLVCMYHLANGYQAAGKTDKALLLLQETLKLMTATLGTDHPDSLSSMAELAGCYRVAGKMDEALQLYEETLKLTTAKLGPDHPDTLASMNNLAVGYNVAGKLDKALPLLEETLKLTTAKLGADHPNTLVSMNQLANVYQAAGKLDKALPLLEESLKLRIAKLGADHPDTLKSMGSLANGYQAASKLDKALPLLVKTLKLQTAKLGADHPEIFTSMNNLATCYLVYGQLDKALLLFEETLKLRIAKLGADHPDTLNSMVNLAYGYRDAGQLDKALPLFEETLKLRIAKLGADHTDTLTTMGNLGKAYCVAKQGEKAAPLLVAFIAAQRKRFPMDTLQFAGQIVQVSRDLMTVQQFSAAEEMLRECLTIREKKEPDEWRTFNTQSMLGGALLGQKKYADAEPLLLKGYEGMKAREKTIPPPGATRIPEALDRLIELYTATNQPDEAKKWHAERAKYPEELPVPREK